MKKSMAIIAAIVLLVGSQGGVAQTQERSGMKWDNTDRVLLGTAITFLGVDWSQTRYIASHPDQFHETNRFLGNQPSAGKVNGYFAAAIIGTVGVAVVLPSRYRKFWLGGISIIEISVVQNNYSIGIKTNF